MAILEKEVIGVDELKEIIRKIERKKALFINSLHSSNLNLQGAVPVSLEYDGDQFIAYSPDLDIYGCGESEYEAMEDVRASIVDLYYDLKEERLGQDLQNIWEHLQSKSKRESQ
ncbi:MAG: hypothetical protein V2A53_01085 [bacterium]